MKELLIFLLLIFFIENKQQIIEPITKPNNAIITKQSKSLSSNPTEEPIKQIKFCDGGKKVLGFCKCPRGYILYNGICTKQPPVKCEGGKLYGFNCICPRWTKLIKGKCVSWLRTTEIN